VFLKYTGSITDGIPSSPETNSPSANQEIPTIL
jgi:hypothetical protein